MSSSAGRVKVSSSMGSVVPESFDDLGPVIPALVRLKEWDSVISGGRGATEKGVILPLLVVGSTEVTSKRARETRRLVYLGSGCLGSAEAVQNEQRDVLKVFGVSLASYTLMGQNFSQRPKAEGVSGLKAAPK
jgi:hypothetical protein